MNNRCSRSHWPRPRLPSLRIACQRGRSSVGRASASQAEGREFEPRRPLRASAAYVAFLVVAELPSLKGCPKYVPGAACYRGHERGSASADRACLPGRAQAWTGLVFQVSAARRSPGATEAGAGVVGSGQACGGSFDQAFWPRTGCATRLTRRAGGPWRHRCGWGRCSLTPPPRGSVQISGVAYLCGCGRRVSTGIEEQVRSGRCRGRAMDTETLPR
jgi:hypothetical protein